MIVGNGDLPDDAAGRIDASDIVIRFNDCRSVGRGGTKTDIIAVCNTGRPALSMLAGGVWKSSPAVERASEFWGVRDPAKFEAMRATLAGTHPELDDFCDDYTEGFATFAAVTGRRFRVIPAAVHETLDDELLALAPPPYVVPSSGLVVIADVLETMAGPDDTVVLAGFGHAGWEWHPFEAERAWADDLARAGLVRRLHAASDALQPAIAEVSS
ncbi:Urease operon accessory protein [Sinorhizobium sp. BG8]|uniref:Urease operon accessory protein n=1 Tax=Sinorhizobium sp. BG8 TaxID=2613773 RepID=UPI00193D6BD4|nr:Urease operon accessory protein [Sinorhizobium sp. BG8]QRM57012.1 Urease operon accessory protein [Sinorhizobium sp. BG8]